MNRTRTVIVALTSILLLGGMMAPPSASAPVWLSSNVSWTNPDAKAPKVVDLRYAHRKRFDRVVIEIRGKIPGGQTHYQRTFSYDPSGLAVPIAGRSGLQVALSPAFGHNARGDNVYAGPKIARPRFQTLKALAYTGDTEGVVSFAFALTYRAPYRVFTLTDPQRLVIDFRHQG